jgi:hypothetical protein
VRVEVGRLWNQLREYYESDGREDRTKTRVAEGRLSLRITVEAAERPKITVEAAGARAAESGASLAESARSQTPIADFPPDSEATGRMAR